MLEAWNWSGLRTERCIAAVTPGWLLQWLVRLQQLSQAGEIYQSFDSCGSVASCGMNLNKH